MCKPLPDKDRFSEWKETHWDRKHRAAIPLLAATKPAAAHPAPIPDHLCISNARRCLPPPFCASLRCGSALQKARSEEHTSELQSQSNLVCRLLLEKKNDTDRRTQSADI